MVKRVLVVGAVFVASLLSGCGGGCPMREASAPQETAPAGENATAATESGPLEAAAPATESDPPEKIETVDCTRIDDPAYRKQVEASGIDPDSIDCFENDTGG